MSDLFGVAGVRTVFGLLLLFFYRSLTSRAYSHYAASDRRRIKSGFHKTGQLCGSSPHSTISSNYLKTFASQGKNLVHLIDRPDEPYCFRLHRDRVFYVSEASMRLGISVARPNLVSLGTCFGKFSKSGKFKLHITALDYVAQYAKYKVRF